MKIYIVFILIFLSFSTFLYGQNNGFMGKKNFISADIRVYAPIIYGLSTSDANSEYNKTEGPNFAPKSNLLDYGFNLTIGRAASRNFGLMLQISSSRYDFAVTDNQYSLDASNFFNTGDYYQVLKINWLKAKVTTVMPIIEFTGNSGLLPLGLSHQIGLGFSTNKLLKDDYNVLIADAYGQQFIQKENLYDYSSKGFKSYVFMYKINLRIPINDYLLFNLGFRYNVNYYPKVFQGLNSSSETKYLIENINLRDYMRSKEFRNVLSLETGLSFCF